MRKYEICIYQFAGGLLSGEHLSTGQISDYCLCLFVYLCLYVCLSMYVCGCMSVCVLLSACVCVCLSEYVSLSVCVMCDCMWSVCVYLNLWHTKTYIHVRTYSDRHTHTDRQPSDNFVLANTF